MTERFSIEALLDPDLMADGFLKYVWKNMVTEGSEEGASNLLNSFADILISGDQSQWSQNVEYYRSQGYSDERAFEYALGDQALGLGLDVLGGMLSGGLLAGGYGGTQMLGASGRYRGNRVEDNASGGYNEIDKDSERDTYYEYRPERAGEPGRVPGTAGENLRQEAGVAQRRTETEIQDALGERVEARDRYNPNWSAGTNKAAEIVSGFGGECVVEPDAQIRTRNNGRAPAYTSNGVVHLSDNIDPELGVTIGNHERVHQIKQMGNPQYLEFIDETYNRLNKMSSQLDDVLSVISQARYGDADYISLTTDQFNVIMDELNAVLYGVYKTDPAAAQRNFGEVFLDYAVHIRELDAIVAASSHSSDDVQHGHEQSQSSAHTTEESAYVDIKHSLPKSQQVQALTAVAHTAQERAALEKYKNAVTLLENRRTQLARTQAELQRIASKGGAGSAQYDKLRGDAAQLDRMVTEAERKVRKVENGATVRGLRDKADSKAPVDTNSEYGNILNIKTQNGICVNEMSQHTFDRCAERNVLGTEIVDALQCPMHIGEVKIDELGRKSQRFIGEKATVNINPDTGIITTIWKTGRSTRNKYKRGV